MLSHWIAPWPTHTFPLWSPKLQGTRHLSFSRPATTMSETGFFPHPHYAPGKLISFEQPEHTEWTVTAKLSQRNSN